jgi:hypothetical protein
VDVFLAGRARDAVERFGPLVLAVGDVARSGVLRGLLALERGDVRRAESLFRGSLRVWGSAQLAARGEGIDFPGRRVAEEALLMLQQKK